MFLFLINFIQREQGEGSFSMNFVCHLDSEVPAVSLLSAVSVFFSDKITFMLKKKTKKKTGLILLSYFFFMIQIPYKSCSHDFLSIYHIYMLWVQKISTPLVFRLLNILTFFACVTLFWKCLFLRSSHDWLLLIIQKGFS